MFIGLQEYFQIRYKLNLQYFRKSAQQIPDDSEIINADWKLQIIKAENLDNHCDCGFDLVIEDAFSAGLFQFVQEKGKVLALEELAVESRVAFFEEVVIHVQGGQHTLF